MCSLCCVKVGDRVSNFKHDKTAWVACSKKVARLKGVASRDEKSSMLA